MNSGFRSNKRKLVKVSTLVSYRLNNEFVKANAGTLLCLRKIESDVKFRGFLCEM